MMRASALAWSIALLLCSCSRPDDQQTGTIGEKEMQEAQRKLKPEAKLRLDSANAAFRRDDFASASRLYREAAQLDEEQSAAAWFGVYMAEVALKNPAAADSALARARNKQPGASLLREDKAEKGEKETQ